MMNMTAAELTQLSNRHGLLEYWYERKELESPVRKAVPFQWRWSDIQPLLNVAAKTVPVEMAHRRALLMANPGMAPRPFMTSTLYAGCSLYNPGEQAEVHRHMSSASRFVLAGKGGYTTIDGEKCTMKRGDLILNPNGAWHDHGNDGPDPVIWVDVLDLPLAEGLNSSYFDFDYSESPDGTNSGASVRRRVQTITRPPDYSSRLYATGGIVPRLPSHKRAKGLGSPMYVYRWADTFDALIRLKDIFEDPRDGTIVEYSDPVNGGPVLPTMSFRSQLLRPGARLEWQRQTASTFFCVAQGHGRTELEGSAIEWEENDLFILPSWHWYRLENVSAENDAILYAVSDAPALEKLGFQRAQGRAPNGDIIELSREMLSQDLR
jgi:gentisate 1,2-dioxygenase